MQKSTVGSCLLLVVACIWGSGFIASQFALDAGVGPELLMVVRFMVASGVIGIAFFPTLKKATKQDIIRVIPGGICLFFAFFIQIVALQFTTPANNAFLTATNVVIVPFLWWCITRHKPEGKVFIASVVCLIGVAILSFQVGTGISFAIGDSLTLLCAVFFAAQIVATGMVAEKLNTPTIIFFQFSTAAILSLIVFVVFTNRDMSTLMSPMGFGSVLYLGLCSTCLCYFLQTYAQKYVNASRAAILLGTEALFGSLFSVILGFDSLRWNMVLGGGIIMIALMMTEGLFHKKS